MSGQEAGSFQEDRQEYMARRERLLGYLKSRGYEPDESPQLPKGITEAMLLAGASAVWPDNSPAPWAVGGFHEWINDLWGGGGPHNEIKQMVMAIYLAMIAASDQGGTSA